MLRRKRLADYDKKNYYRYFSDLPANQGTKAFLEREIMVLSHTVEKGLSHKNIRAKFALENVGKLADYLKRYSEESEPDEYVLSLGSSILKKYADVNTQLGVPESELGIEFPVLSADCHPAGAYTVGKEDLFAASEAGFGQFSAARRSVRLYDARSKSIPNDILKECVSLAMTSPSACNRQSTRVKVVTESEKIREITKIQLGSSGFGENAGAMLIIASDMRYYMTSERRLPAFDGGLFTMQLVNALYYKKLGACILNGSLTGEQEQAIRSVINIPDYEMIAAIVAVSDIPDGESICVAYSDRKNAEDIVSYC